MTTNKYRNVRTEIDGIAFQSKAEAFRYAELKLLQHAGVISDLELQPRFPLDVKGNRVATFVGDFAYRDAKGLLTVEDVKGVQTPLFRLKAKLFRALYGFEITLIGKGARA